MASKGGQDQDSTLSPLPKSSTWLVVAILASVSAGSPEDEDVEEPEGGDDGGGDGGDDEDGGPGRHRRRRVEQGAAGKRGGRREGDRGLGGDDAVAGEGFSYWE